MDDEKQILLGFLSKPKSLYALYANQFPSKVGGKPVWLNPEHLPSEVDLTCVVCHNVMTFLLQIYAAREEPYAFHRMVYVFGCQPCGNQFRVYRCQLQRENLYFSYYPVEDTSASCKEYQKDYGVLLQQQCCSLCGLPSAIKTSFRDYEEGNVTSELGSDACAVYPSLHRRCKNAVESQSIRAIFEEWELEIEEEELEEASPIDATTHSHEYDLWKRYNQTLQENPEETLDESEQQAFEEISAKLLKDDPTFTYFLHRTRMNKGHVVRYDLKGKPLWFCEEEQLLEDPPNCPSCDGPRCFEFQVQPDLLHFLGDNRFDFGILAVYTCKRSCSNDMRMTVVGEVSETTVLEESTKLQPTSRSTPIYYFEEYIYVQPDTSATH